MSLTTRSAKQQPTVMLLNGRGDYLLNLPTLRAISKVFAGQITLVIKKGAHALFFSDLPVARLIEPDFTMSPAGPLFDANALATAIGPTDLFISLNPWHTASTDELLACLQAAYTLGFFAGFDARLALDFNKHNCDLAFDVAHCLASELNINSFSQAPQPASRYQQQAKGLYHHLPANAAMVMVHGETSPAKMWDDARFAEVMHWLLALNPLLFIFDLGLASIGAGQFDSEPRVIRCNELILPVAVALFEYADLFVGIDSCFLHAADLYRVPGIGLFGSTSAAEFGFRFGLHQHVSATTMQQIRTKDVIHAIEKLIASQPSADLVN